MMDNELPIKTHVSKPLVSSIGGCYHTIEHVVISTMDTGTSLLEYGLLLLYIPGFLCNEHVFIALRKYML